MLIKPRDPHLFFWKLLKCFLLASLGLIIILVCSLFQQVPLPPHGDYFYTSLFRNNFSLIAKILFVLVGFLIGYRYRLNPIYAGLSLILVFPITALAESVVYRGSHNLIPFEFVYHLWLAVPSIVAVFLGKLLSKRLAK